MTVVSTKEFNTDQDKYFSLAMKEQLYIRKGENVFMICIANDKINKHKKPDDDFRRAITAEKLLEGIYEDIDKKFTYRLK